MECLLLSLVWYRWYLLFLSLIHIFERYERKQPTTEAEYLKQTSLRKASKENISTAMNASPLFTAWNYSL